MCGFAALGRRAFAKIAAVAMPALLPIDVLLIAALTPDNRAVRALIHAVDGPNVTSERLRLVAANASRTVRLHIDRLFVPAERVTSVAPYTPPPPDDGLTETK